MNKTAKIINISNVSGGVGKSTTAIELATYFGMQGKKVLIVDADMQASATDCIGAKGQPLTIKELQAMDEKIESRGMGKYSSKCPYAECRKIKGLENIY